MSITKLPAHTSLRDQQFVQVAGPDGILSSYQYDEQQRALYFKESQVIFPSFHGPTHIAEDPVPNASCDSPGLMSADDKCKLDALLQTRIGVLGYQGSGLPDDSGWMQGDLILAAGTDFITLERLGNVIRFLVDSPIPYQCNCESCTQIYLQQDETDVSAIRPPVCSGKLPSLNVYGELKIFAFPESTIVDPNNAGATLNNKGRYPALIFKRYLNSITPGLASFEVILKRDQINQLTTEIGWAFVPGASGVPVCAWFTGKDNDGNQTRFDITPEAEPGLLGMFLYKGHLLSKKMGVVTGYTTTVLSTNQYVVKEWDVDAAKATGDPVTARNIWQYSNPENPASGSNPKTLILDASVDLLPIGTLVDLWFFKVGEIAGEDQRRYYFSHKPSLNPNYIWTWVGNVQFGDVAIARDEVQANAGTDAGATDISAAIQVSAIRDFEPNLWGLTGYDDPLISFDIASTAGTEVGDVSQQHRATIDTALPGLKVVASTVSQDNFSERPIVLWNRVNVCNALIRMDIGRPENSNFSPYDLKLRSQIDQFDNQYLQVIGTGEINGLYYIRVCGVNFKDLPQFGALRVISPSNSNYIYNYNRKFAFPTFITNEVGIPGSENPPSYCGSVMLAGGSGANDPYLGNVGDILELLHQEYSSPVVRIEFAFDELTSLVTLQFKVGNLDMSLPYESDDSDDDVDDYVRGLAPGYAVSAIYTQAGTFTGVGTRPDVSTDGFVVYDGGVQIGGTQSEYWNSLLVMLRGGQVWIWWNNLLIPPSPSLSSALSTPVTIDTPYFPIDQDTNRQFGKIGARLWPGATVRRMDVRTQITQFSEFSLAQIEIV